MKLEENCTFLNIRENMRQIGGPYEDFRVLRKMLNPKVKNRLELLQNGE